MKLQRFCSSATYWYWMAEWRGYVSIHPTVEGAILGCYNAASVIH